MATPASTSTPSPTESAQPTCTTAIPDQNGWVPSDACNANYGFYPSFEWNLVFAIAFGLTTVAHLVQMFVYRKVCQPPPPSQTRNHKSKSVVD